MLLSLPTELILQISSYLLPLRTTFDFCPVPRDLLSLTLVCKTTYYVANYCLLRDGVYLISGKAIRNLAEGLLSDNGNRCLYAIGIKTTIITHPREALIQITDEDHGEIGDGHFRNGVRRPPRRRLLRPHACTIRPKEVFRQHVSAFSLFFYSVGHCLTRLVLDSKFHRLAANGCDPSPNHSDQVRKAFKYLTSLEEFYCIDGDRYSCPNKDDVDLPVWTYFPKLKRLALTRPTDVTSKAFLDGIASVKTLTHLLLMCPESLEKEIPDNYTPGAKTIEQIIIVQFKKFIVGHTPAPRDCVAKNTFLSQMHESSMYRSTDCPGRILIMDASASVGSHSGASRDWKDWLFEHARKGLLWDLKPGKYLEKKLEL